MPKFSFIFPLLVVGSSLYNGATAQSLSANKLIKKPKPIRTELSVGGRLTSDGWNIYIDKGYVHSQESKPQLRDQFHDVRLFQLEFGEHKHPKEIKHTLSDQSSGQKTKPFIFGKINNFYALKLGYGIRKMIAGKPEPGTVSIHWVGLAGLSLGLEKPYYLDGYVSQDNNGVLTPATFKYTDETKESFLNTQYIRGGAGFQQGLSEIQYIPGVHAKTALHFDFAASRHNLMAVETGIGVEYYSRAIQLMANQEAKPYFVNLFASFQLGRRW